jgi:orotate phosphoribosyltransferase
MNNDRKRIVKELLGINAIKLQPYMPFTWASGWKSPIYCDNRKTLAYPTIRQLIKEQFVGIINTEFSEAEVVAGVATGAIAQGALVADALELPFVYIRSTPKQHGLENLIEGEIKAGQKVVVIEDLISTGSSSLKAVEALRNAGCLVIGMLAIFSYQFPISEKNFKEAGCKLVTLCDYSTLIELALETNYLQQSDLETLNKWREAPEKWNG